MPARAQSRSGPKCDKNTKFSIDKICKKPHNENMKKTVTRFMDMHSGGRLKTPYTHIYIEEPLSEALKTFKDLFKRDPDNVTCKCCGEDFVYEEYESLEQATAYDRGCQWNDGEYSEKTAKKTVEEFFSGNNLALLVCES